MGWWAWSHGHHEVTGVGSSLWSLLRARERGLGVGRTPGVGTAGASLLVRWVGDGPSPQSSSGTGVDRGAPSRGDTAHSRPLQPGSQLSPNRRAPGPAAASAEATSRQKRLVCPGGCPGQLLLPRGPPKSPRRRLPCSP